MKNVSKKIELAANLAIIAAVLIWIGVSLKSYFSQNNPTGSQAITQPKTGIAAGERISLLDVEWAKNGLTMLIAVAPGCNFCADSAPFYKYLSRVIDGRDYIRIITLLPESASEDTLAEIGLPAYEVKKVAFKSLGINGTPAIILVNSEGVVTNIWLGKLNKRQESDLINLVKNEEPVPSISVTELVDAISDGQKIIVLDVSNRKGYAKGHIPGAKNIPIDELQSRALQELSDSSRIVAYCGCETDNLGKMATHILKSSGFEDVFLLRGGLNAWGSEGLPKETKELTKYNQ